MSRKGRAKSRPRPRCPTGREGGFIVEQRALGYAFDEIRPILHARWGSADKVPLEEVEVREAKIKAAKMKARRSLPEALQMPRGTGGRDAGEIERMGRGRANASGKGRPCGPALTE